MSEPKTEARARVRLTIEFEIPGGSWSTDEKLCILERQARENAMECLRQGFVVDGLAISKAASTIARVIGEPEIDAVVFRSKR